MMFTRVVWLIVAALAVLDLLFVLFAIRRATARQTVVRLVATSLLLFGIASSAAQRFEQHDDLTWGLFPVACGLAVYAGSLPSRWFR